MNWKEEIKKYPKSIKLLKKWLFLKPGDEGDLGLNMISKLLHTERRLYDFFDEQGIFISMWIWYEVDDNGRGTDIPIFKPSIGGMGIDMLYPDGYKSRKEAEEATFKKAFEILENQLN